MTQPMVILGLSLALMAIALVCFAVRNNIFAGTTHPRSADVVTFRSLSEEAMKRSPRG